MKNVIAQTPFLNGVRRVSFFRLATQRLRKQNAASKIFARLMLRNYPGQLALFSEMRYTQLTFPLNYTKILEAKSAFKILVRLMPKVNPLRSALFGSLV
ncbi:hypothetical protein ACFQHW_04140 [Lapidilactobacillus achengensis]|uniref:Uncharacterized protein n=1 Tax=Lapidilactobacillus achengensis TaxID=2486000 RepID=A0ABW1ULE6_9LACO|nr:hypothetical protein [Lapidilactobacillus achengensis]